MAEITAAAVKALREKTDLPMMECKKALMAADGDEAKAMQILQEQVGKVIGKRAQNATDEGRIFIAASSDGSEVAAVEILCESAPVAGGQDLVQFGTALAEHLLQGPGAESADELLAQTPSGGKGTFREMFETMINKIREKIVVSRVARRKGTVGTYVHHDGKTAVIFEAEGTPKNPAILRDIAMHIAALRPTVANVEDVEPSTVAEARARMMEEARATGKPENILEKIVEGRMKTFYRDEAGVLTEQLFAKDDSKTVSQVLAESGLKAKGFTLWILGK